MNKLLGNMTTKESMPKDKGKAFEWCTKERGLTWAEVARAAEVSPQVVNNWRKRGVSMSHAMKVADLLDCSPSDISVFSGGTGAQYAEHAPQQAGYQVKEPEPPSPQELAAALMQYSAAKKEVREFVDWLLSLDPVQAQAFVRAVVMPRMLGARNEDDQQEAV